MSKHIIPPFMIPTRREPAQIPLPAPQPSIYDRRPADESDREREPFSIDISGDDGDQDFEPSKTYRC
ncbi:MAG: hypothetical protein P4L53_23325 [Candidatus Obscuribacterales bacterium]|nr:hypothetical protein [Candidatus Obscuribacterales bacterium]